jgi:hypothetical protein
MKRWFDRSAEFLPSWQTVEAGDGLRKARVGCWVGAVILGLVNLVTGGEQGAVKAHPQAVASVHAAGEVDRPEMVPFVVADARVLQGVVVDEVDAELKGAWQYSTHTPPYVGLGYLHDMKAGKGEKSVTFTPDLPAAGWYEVRLAHCYNVRRSTRTPVTVHHATGEVTVRINQQEEPEHGRLFRSLGVFQFEARKKGWVRVSNEGTEEGKVVIADAVQFLPVSAPQAK